MALCKRGVHTDELQSTLKRHGVDHGGQHAHVVALGALHAAFCSLNAAKNVAATDHNGTFNALLYKGLNFARIQRKLLVVNAKLLFTHQGFTTQL